MKSHNDKHDGSSRPKLLPQVQNEFSPAHYGIRTEQPFPKWIKQFVLFGRATEELLADQNARIRMTYTHLLNRGGQGMSSPANV